MTKYNQELHNTDKYRTVVGSVTATEKVLTNTLSGDADRMVISTHPSLSASAKYAGGDSITMSWKNPSLSATTGYGPGLSGAGFSWGGGLWFGGIQSNPSSKTYNTTHDGISGVSHPVVLQHFHHEFKTANDWEHFIDWDVRKFSGAHIQLMERGYDYQNNVGGQYTRHYTMDMITTWPNDHSMSGETIVTMQQGTGGSPTQIVGPSPTTFMVGYAEFAGWGYSTGGDLGNGTHTPLNASNSIARIFVKAPMIRDSIRGLMWFYTQEPRPFELYA